MAFPLEARLRPHWRRAVAEPGCKSYDVKLEKKLEHTCVDKLKRSTTKNIIFFATNLW
jgi:hypothetical protein